MFKSVKAFFDAANGRRVSKTVAGVLTAEDWPETAARIRTQLTAQGAAEADIVETPEEIRIGGQYWRKPKLVKYQEGVLKARSADYAFTPDGTDTPVYGDKKGATVAGDALTKAYPNGMLVTFRIME